MTTLYELISVCKKAVELYNQRGEEAGQSGDVDVAESLFESSLRLDKILSEIQKEYQTNNYLSVHAVLEWLKELNTNYYFEIMDALMLIKDDDSSEIEKRKKRIEYVEKFLK